MAENKTQATDADVLEFLNNVPDERKRQDSLAVLEMIREITGEEPVMWGSSIVGFGSYHYKYASGREGDSPMVGFSPRKQNLTLYIMGDYEHFDELMEKLGKHTTGVACLYLKRLSDVDQDVLRQLITATYEHVKQTNR